VVSKSMIPRPRRVAAGNQSGAVDGGARGIRRTGFRAMSAAGGHLAVQGFLYDTHSTQNPQVLGKQYGGEVTADSRGRSRIVLRTRL